MHWNDRFIKLLKQIIISQGNVPVSGDCLNWNERVLRLLEQIRDGTTAGLPLHAVRHQDGGIDEVATATPAAAAIPKADGSGTLDAWISTASQSVVGISRFATTAEVLTGTALALGISPATLLGSMLSRISINANTVLAVSAFFHTVLVDASSGVVTATLPTAVGNDARRFSIKKVDSTSNNVIVSAAGSETVDGISSSTIKKQDGSIEVASDNSNWFIIG